jgi:hypothetical protein
MLAGAASGKFDTTSLHWDGRIKGEKWLVPNTTLPTKEKHWTQWTITKSANWEEHMKNGARNLKEECAKWDRGRTQPGTWWTASSAHILHGSCSESHLPWNFETRDSTDNLSNHRSIQSKGTGNNFTKHHYSELHQYLHINWTFNLSYWTHTT